MLKDIQDREYFIRTTVYGKVKIIGHYKNLTDLVSSHNSDLLSKGHYNANLYQSDTAWYLDNVRVGDRSFNLMRAYDEYGNFMSPDRLVGYYREYYNSRSFAWSYWFSGCGSKRNWRKGGGYRRMKTFGERRTSCSEEHKQYIRGARNKAGLPNNWDDIYRQIDNNWKTHRKTQYRNVDKMDA